MLITPRENDELIIKEDSTKTQTVRRLITIRPKLTGGKIANRSIPLYKGGPLRAALLYMFGKEASIPYGKCDRGGNSFPLCGQESAAEAVGNVGGSGRKRKVKRDVDVKNTVLYDSDQSMPINSSSPRPGTSVQQAAPQAAPAGAQYPPVMPPFPFGMPNAFGMSQLSSRKTRLPYQAHNGSRRVRVR
ncbi:hypothetical protein MN608_08585 [Microdochium nivale]|nr:hypothetical protein MN608_08585 [Microdochium nivale]